jgi:hypothetical protein
VDRHRRRRRGLATARRRRPSHLGGARRLDAAGPADPRTGTGTPFDAFDRFAHVKRDGDATLDELVGRFAELRSGNLDRLGELVSESDLERRGLHPSLEEVTLRELFATWAVHDLDHVAQVFAGLAGSLDADVGPWKAYLGILIRRDDPSVVPD